MENPEALKIMAQQAACYPWSGAINIYVASGDMSGHATGITWEPHVSGSFVPVLFTLDRDQAQALMDQLWDCGIRPTQGSGSAGALAATERHLADLQKIVFSKGENSDD